MVCVEEEKSGRKGLNGGSEEEWNVGTGEGGLFERY